VGGLGTICETVLPRCESRRVRVRVLREHCAGSEVEFGLHGHVGPYSFVDLVWRRQVECRQVCVFVL
jgi:hypothetical protein